MALYGKDRLTQALVRKDGKLVPVPMKEALDLVAAKMAETISAHGKDAVAIYGSGQWTIPDGYVASKFMKGGHRHQQPRSQRPALHVERGHRAS